MTPTSSASAVDSHRNATSKSTGRGGLLSKLLAPIKGSAPRAGTPTRTRLERYSAPPSASQGMLARSSAPDMVGATTGAGSGQQANPVGQQGTASSALQKTATVDLGFPRDYEDKYTVLRQLGKGGNGVVNLVQCKETGEVFASKSILKVLKEGSDKKKAGHIEALKREINVLTKLKGSLNIIKLEGVFEDDENVHIVQEYCSGGELHHAIGTRHYSERTVASYMRAALRTLAQCHAHHILHRDIKPGNFMLLSEDERAPLKAIDFGLAVPYEPEVLPLTNLGIEGTPWFMAPETLSSQFMPASDIWAAGVMAYQLLTGRFPFDDKKNMANPSITAIWKSILSDPLDLNKPWWAGISEEAKDFVARLLERDPAKRPTAKEALRHPWLQGNSSERSTGKRLQQSVVARIQRFAGASTFKRSVLQMIANELLEKPHMLQALDGCLLSDTGRPVVANPSASCLEPIYKQLKLDVQEEVPSSEVAGALRALGFRLADSEVERLLEQLDPAGTGTITRAAFAASQVDWRHLQANHKDQWVALAQEVFSSLDVDHDGVLRVDEIMNHLTQAVGESDLESAVDLAMEEAGQEGDPQGMDFNDFLTMLKVSSVDSLDMYDERLGSTWGAGPASIDRLNLMLHKSQSLGSMAGGDSRHGGASLLATLGNNAAHEGTQHSDAGSSQHPFEMDMSQHGGGSSAHGSSHGPGGSLRAGGGLPRGAAGSAWRFDVGGGAAAAPAAPPAGTAWRFDVAGGAQQQPAAPAAPQQGAASAFRFDVAGPQSHQPPPPAANAMAWRFDVAGPNSPSHANNKQAMLAAGGAWRFDPPSSPGAGLNGPAGAASPFSNQQQTTTGEVSGLGRNGGGYFDRRHHGSMLYKQSLAQAACRAGLPTAGSLVRPLETVQE